MNNIRDIPLVHLQEPSGHGVLVDRAPKIISDIQILRAVAILMVLTQHLSITATLRDASPMTWTLPFWAGVELFFIISGVVVTQSILGRTIAPVAFLMRRAFRLWPAIMVFLLVSLVVSILAYSLPEGSWGRNTFAATPDDFGREAGGVLFGYFINLSEDYLYTNGAMWSLSVEFQFYAGYAVLLSLLAAIRASPAVAGRLILVTAGALYAAALLQRVGILFGVHPFAGTLVDYIRVWRFDFMLLGVVVALLPGIEWPGGAAVVPLLMVVPLILLALSDDPLSAAETSPLNTIVVPIVGLCFAVVVWLAKGQSAFTGQNSSKLYAALEWIGNRSFSIYLLHFPLMVLVWLLLYHVTPKIFSMNPFIYGAAQAVLTLPLTAVAAHYCYTLVELPWQRRGKRLAASRQNGRG